MSEVHWIKLKTEMFSDDKIRLIESMPEADAILVIWIKLLIQAGRTNANGYIFLNENVPFTADMLATLFNKPLTIVRLALKTLSEFGMIVIDDNGKILIENWSKHQNVEGMEKIREQTRLRVAKHRENQKLLSTTLKKEKDSDTDSEECVTETLQVTLQEKDQMFYKFWEIYPKKVKKKKSKEKFMKVCKDKLTFEKIINGLNRDIKSKDWSKEEGRFIPHPTAWLNNERWDDETYESDQQQAITKTIPMLKDGDEGWK